MAVIGEKLGLYKALTDEPMTSTELAAKTKTDERYLREWQASQAAGGYVTYDAETGKFSLNAQTCTLANADSPAYVQAAGAVRPSHFGSLPQSLRAPSMGPAKSEGGKKATLRAIVAVARKLSVLLHRLWVSGNLTNPFLRWSEDFVDEPLSWWDR